MVTTHNTTFGDLLLKRLVRFFSADWSGALLAVIVLSVSIELATAGKPFFHPSNIMTILNNSAALGIVAAGMTLVIITAGIDLSVGSVVGMSAALTGYVASYWGFAPVAAILFGLMVGLVIGLTHGTLVAKFGMPAFIVTLAGLTIWRGTGHLATDARATPKLDEMFNYFGRHNPLTSLRESYTEGTLNEFLMPIGKFVDAMWMEYFRTFQMSLIILIVFYFLLAKIIHNTKFGRYTYAIGSNEQGARQAGINVIYYKILAYVACSMTAALAAIMFLGRAPYAKSDYGMMWELDAIAAVVIGGTSLFGGRGSIWGTFLGVILLKLIANGLTLAQLETFWQMVVTGLIILVAVGIDIVRQNSSPAKVKQLLITIAAVMMFFSFISPGAPALQSKTQILEHNVATNIEKQSESTNIRLEPTQRERILDENQLVELKETISNNKWIALLLFIFTVLLSILIFKPEKKYIFAGLGIFVVAAVIAGASGFANVIPFLVLGGLLLLSSLSIDYIFTRAKELDDMEQAA